MNGRQKAILRQNRVKIVEDLEPRNGVLDCLIEEEILTENDAEEIDSASTRKERCQALLRILPTRGPAAYGAFKKALIKNSLHHIVEKMAPDLEEQKAVTSVITPCNSCEKSLANITDSNTFKRFNFKSKDVFSAHICDVIENVEPRDIFDQLFQDEMLTEDDIEEIKSFSVRRKRSEKLIEILLQKDKNVFVSLVRSMRKKYKFIADAIEKDIKEDIDEDCNGGNETSLTKQVSTVTSQRQSQKLVLAFNYLSTLVNQGDFKKFAETTFRLKQRCSKNSDLLCIIGYLHACRDLFQADFDSAKKEIKTNLELVPKTSNPRYFTLEILTAKIRLYVIQKRIGKLESTQDDAMMLLETDPEGCSGRAAGWLCINQARTMTTRMSCLNLCKTESLRAYENLFKRAKASLQQSMTNFKKDGGKDGPFGFGFAVTRMIVLLMRCGDNGKTMEVLQPPLEDIQTANQYINHLEDSDIEMSAILNMHFSLARCDYQYRRHNYRRAREHAQCALQFASKLNILEFKEHVSNRINFLELKISSIQVEYETEFVKTFLLDDCIDTWESESQ